MKLSDGAGVEMCLLDSVSMLGPQRGEAGGSSTRMILLILDIRVPDLHDAITNRAVLGCGNALTKHLLQ